MRNAGGPKVFLSHANADKPRLRELGFVEVLGAAGCRVFVDRPWDMYPGGPPAHVDGLAPGENWRVQLLQTVRAADRVIFCFSSDLVSRVEAESVWLIEEMSIALRSRPLLSFHIAGRTDLSPLGWAGRLFESDQDIVHPPGDPCLGPLIALTRWAVPGADQEPAFWMRNLKDEQQRLAEKYEQGYIERPVRFDSQGSLAVTLVPLHRSDRPYVQITIDPLLDAQGKPLRLSRSELFRQLDGILDELPSPDIVREAFLPVGTVPVEIAFKCNPFGVRTWGAPAAWAWEDKHLVAISLETGQLLPDEQHAAAWLCL